MVSFTEANFYTLNGVTHTLGTLAHVPYSLFQLLREIFAHLCARLCVNVFDNRNGTSWQCKMKFVWQGGMRVRTIKNCVLGGAGGGKCF